MILQRITYARGASHNAFVHTPYQHGHPREIIKHLREIKGFPSDRALAVAAGVNQPNLSRYLSGKSQTMEVETFVALARILEVTLSELLGEVPLSSGGHVREMVQVMHMLPEPEQRALVAAGQAMAKALAIN